MSPSAVRVENQSGGQEQPGKELGDATRCSLGVRLHGLDAVTSDLCNLLEVACCPLTAPVRERLRFENLLAELSATFVHLPASQVDSQIDHALHRLVDFLGVERGGLAEFLMDQKQLVITHSYHLPGAPLLPRTIL